MSGMEDTWWTRDLPVLDVVVRLREDYSHFPEVIDIARETGFSTEDVARALVSMNGPFVSLELTGGGAERWFVKAVTPAARQAVGQWPTPENVVARLAEAFSEAAGQEQDPERRGKLRAVASFLRETGKDFAAEVVAKVIARQAGMG
jgi:hypothetical protein